MKRLIPLILLIFAGAVVAQSSVEQRVLKQIQEIYQTEGGITFSSLYNDERFSTEERDFLGRLYETFFAIPAYLKSEHGETGQIPSRADLAENFDVSTQSVELLLTVMERDGRIPPLFVRDDGTGEIEQLRVANIDAFLESRSGPVRVTGWQGEKLPGFSLPSLEGELLTDQDLLGTNSVLYFWFTGCPPCVRMAPSLAELTEKHRSSDLRFVGFNADDELGLGTSNESRLDYLEKQGLDFTNVNVDEEVLSRFGGISVYPTLFFVDEAGIVQDHLINFQSKEKLKETIDQLLNAR